MKTIKPQAEARVREFRAEKEGEYNREIENVRVAYDAEGSSRRR